MKDLHIYYRFQSSDGKEQTFNLILDAHTLAQTGPVTEPPAAWTQLEFHQCPNCPLKASEHPYCPVALNLQTLENGFADMWSYDELSMEVTMPERTVSGSTTAQKGASSLLGLMMATSGCPHTVHFKPMARFHLPLASEEDTIYRASSMYLLAQYYMNKDGQKAGLDLNGLLELYQQMRIINSSLAERLRTTSQKDTAINAVILLDLLAKTLPYCIDDNMSEIRYLFEPFLSPTTSK